MLLYGHIIYSITRSNGIFLVVQNKLNGFKDHVPEPSSNKIIQHELATVLLGFNCILSGNRNPFRETEMMICISNREFNTRN